MKSVCHIPAPQRSAILVIYAVGTESLGHAELWPGQVLRGPCSGPYPCCCSSTAQPILDTPSSSDFGKQLNCSFVGVLLLVLPPSPGFPSWVQAEPQLSTRKTQPNMYASNMGHDLVDMASKCAEYPSVFVVDSRAGIPPLPPKPGQMQAQRRRNRITQTMLYLLVSMALFGIVVEACFIYHLYMTKQSSELPQNEKTPNADARKGEHFMDQSTVAPKRTRPPLFQKPLKPLAHLTAGSERPGADGVMPWRMEPELHNLEYKENRLVVEKEGYYYIYSKVCFDEDDATFYHMIVKTTPRYTGTSPIELLRNRYHGEHTKPPQNVGSLQNSYLGGVFHFHKGEAVYVLVKNGRVRLQSSADNYFGMFMV
ncbi:hypothetical protein MHYP_G00305450 [Metynnis hypsauchen]